MPNKAKNLPIAGKVCMRFRKCPMSPKYRAGVGTASCLLIADKPTSDQVRQTIVPVVPGLSGNSICKPSSLPSQPITEHTLSLPNVLTGRQTLPVPHQKFLFP